MRRVPLLSGGLPVVLQDLVNYRQERFELPLLSRLVLTTTRRRIMRQELLQRMPAQTVLATGLPLAELARQDFTPDCTLAPPLSTAATHPPPAPPL
jgi:hypothetical protein